MGKIDKKDRIGVYQKISMGEVYSAYVPKPLPPSPPINMTDLHPLLDKANHVLGRLDGVQSILPEPELFLYMYSRKEAVLSSQIEGTQSSFSELLLFEENEKLMSENENDVVDTLSYVKAMGYGIQRINEDFPLSLRLIREIHKKLMENSRGKNTQPGEFRKSQNWIGGRQPSHAQFVPPPPENLLECLDEFEKFIHDKNTNLPVLIKAALIHVQFETIHPFLDGNGRLGRLLITFILCLEGVLKEPILYLSLYFKNHQKEYYEHLQSVRETGDWESWIQFFLKAVIKTSNEACDTANTILKLFRKHEEQIQQSIKSPSSVLVIYNYFKKHPIVMTKEIVKNNRLSLPTVLRNLKTLENIGIVEEVTRKSRHKIFVYKEYLDILNKGTQWPSGGSGTELNRRHKDFQSSALPTELPSHNY